MAGNDSIHRLWALFAALTAAADGLSSLTRRGDGVPAERVPGVLSLPDHESFLLGLALMGTRQR